MLNSNYIKAFRVPDYFVFNFKMFQRKRSFFTACGDASYYCGENFSALKPVINTVFGLTFKPPDFILIL